MAETLSGMDISKIMAEEGTLVKCVLLRCHPVKSHEDDDDVKPSSSSNDANDINDVKEIQDMSIKEMKRELQSYGVTESFVEKAELVEALQRARQEAAHDANTSKKLPADTEDSTNRKKASESTVVTQEDNTPANEETQDQVPLSHLIDELTIDTTPRKSQVAKLLGGDFTFLGQYESEGIMVMVRRPHWDYDSDGNIVNEEDEEIPPLNPHKLHPPLNDVEVRGDILLMRVAETKEELDEEEDGGNDDGRENLDEPGESTSCENETPTPQATATKIHVPTNDEFFLDYTKEEYLKFAARTDIVWEEPEGDDEEESEDEELELGATELLNGFAAAAAANNDDDDENDEAYDPEAEADSDEEFDSEEHQVGMMNLILGQILRKFHEENGRGPNTLELLDMRKALADKLGVDVPEVDEEACDWDKKVPTPKKHNRKVVVDEERNECETIENGIDGEGVEEKDEVHESDDDVEEVSLKETTAATCNGNSDNSQQPSETTHVSADLKRPADAIENCDSNGSNEQANKKAKLENDIGCS